MNDLNEHEASQLNDEVVMLTDNGNASPDHLIKVIESLVAEVHSKTEMIRELAKHQPCNECGKVGCYHWPIGGRWLCENCYDREVEYRWAEETAQPDL